ncbi:MAG TPA: hypothetical protein HA254_07535 [Candidatus Diapherotrites archaeon]|uniref:Class III signal peptide-containing protein n=1 Tax=Candidatus Iainarchaeum sp. TaxID=3101447 RepID=A0A7J4J1Z0_9ARCH|nr:hypothetical protein [Candidatus Diapherotrites archaeon]
MTCGQVSIEYLLVLAAALSFLSFSLWALSAVHGDINEATDLLNAKRLANDLNYRSSSMGVMGDYSSQSFEAVALHGWQFQSEGGRNFIKISPKNIPVSIPPGIELRFSKKAFLGKFRLLLRKINGRLVLEDY